MTITLLVQELVEFLKNTKLRKMENRVAYLIECIESTYSEITQSNESSKVLNFLKKFDRLMEKYHRNYSRLPTEWLDSIIEFKTVPALVGAPTKEYDDLCPKAKKQRLSAEMANHSPSKICDTFKELLTVENRPSSAKRIADVLTEASPRRLQRIERSIATPCPGFSEEEALALIIELGLSKNKYTHLRRMLLDKGCDMFPAYNRIKERKMEILPNPVIITEKAGSVSLELLLQNTASRIITTLNEEQLKKINNSHLQLICKWGCDGLSALSEYKQCSDSQSTQIEFKSVFMASLVPLRLSLDSTLPSTSRRKSNPTEAIWRNPTPGSKIYCRPISFVYHKETSDLTKAITDKLKDDISRLEDFAFKFDRYSITISFKMFLTMVDGKAANDITGNKSSWKCFICNKSKVNFSNASNNSVVNEDTLEFGIAQLHARIRFLEHFLNLAYDIKYKSIPGNERKNIRANKEMHEMRASEKKRIQDAFKQQTGLNISKPRSNFGNTNDGNTARRFFADYNTAAEITGINKELIRMVNILLLALNSKQKINSDKFGVYAERILKMLADLYPWKDLTPTIHRVLFHGKQIIESHLLPIGELTEEPQEARNRDFRYVQQFSTRKCSRIAQNEDLLNSLLLSSDPFLSSMRSKLTSYHEMTHGDEEEFSDLLDMLDVE